MKRLFGLTLCAVIGLATSVWADHHCCQPKCITPPPPNCPDCSGLCDHCLHIAIGGCEHVHGLIDELHACTCCDRIKAVKKLGHRLHADFCENPEVLDALINALQCDPCWEVREAAAWAILKQKARTEQGVLALYIASKLDPHCMVRDAAAEALDILTLGRKECFTAILVNGDQLIAQLKKSGYRPGSANCAVLIGGAAAAPMIEKKADAGQASPIPTADVPARLPTGR